MLKDEFISTSRKKRNKKLIISPKTIDDYLLEITCMKNELQNSAVMTRLFEICSNHIFSTITHIQCLALGSPASTDLGSRPAKYQTAALLLLADHFNVQYNNIHVWDPIFTDDDKNLFNRLQFLTNEHLFKTNQSNTLYYLPHAPVSVIGSVLSLADSNPNIFIIGNPIYDYEMRIYRPEVQAQKRLIEAIESKTWHSHEIDDKLSAGENYGTALSSMALQFPKRGD